MKVIFVVLILIQISLIVPNPNNRIEKESKEIGRNLSNQRRLGIFDLIKNFVWKVKDVAEKVIDKVKSSPKVMVAVTAVEIAAEKAKTTFNNVCKKVKEIYQIYQYWRTIDGARNKKQKQRWWWMGTSRN